LATENIYQLFVNNLNYLLSRVQRLRNLVAQSAIANCRDEVLDDLERNVGFEQCATNLAKGCVYVCRTQFSLGAQVLEGLD
jgi:hypothetical protein